MTSLANYKAKAARHMLVYGAPKCGKTALVGQLAKHYKLHYFDLEDGVKTLLNPTILEPQYRDNINVFSLPDRQTFPVGIETMLKVLKGGPQRICSKHGKCGCADCLKNDPAGFSEIDVNKLEVDKDVLVIDSYSQLAESSLNYIMRDALMKDNFDAKAGWDEYGKQGRILERIGSIIQVAPFNVVVISHEQMVEMEDKSKKIIPIGGTSSASKVFGKYFDDIVYVELFNRRHVAYSATTSKQNVLAGSRAGVELKDGDGLIKLFQ